MIEGNARKEPWKFPTSNVRHLMEDATNVVHKIMYTEGCTEVELMVAINNLHHAANELERSRLEMKYGVKEI